MKILRGSISFVVCLLGAHAFGACLSNSEIGENVPGSGGASADAASDSHADANAKDAKDGNANDAAVDSALDDLVEQWVKDVCAALAPCCVQDQLVGDEAGCITSFQDWIAAYGLDPKWNGADVPTCLAESLALAQKCDPEWNNPPSCEPPGTKLPGSSCSDDDECAIPLEGTASCEYDDNNVKKCTQKVPGTAGDPCRWTCENEDYTNCFSGVFPEGYIEVTCLVTDGLTCEGTCQPFHSLGESCQMFACGADAFCNHEAKCVTKQPLGASCPEFPYGMEESCAQGLYCAGKQSGVSHSGKCAPSSALGEACSDDEQCPSGNCYQGTCHPKWKFGTYYCK